MIKKVSKKILYSAFSCNKPEDIIEKIKKLDVEVVSFDIFDTLVKRNVSKPTDLFRIIEVNENEFLRKNECMNFYDLRIYAEMRAGQLLDKEEEYSLEDIYRNFKGIDPEKIPEFMEMEENYELEFCTVNKSIYEVYTWCINNNKKVIFVSDMYLSENMLIKLLNNLGYNKFEKLYVSSEIKLRKSTGNLFKYVLNDLNISPQKVIHIGDNIKADFIGAKKNKINSVLIPTKINNMKFIKENQNDYIKSAYVSFINNKSNGNESVSQYYRFGYELLGPLLLGFSKWLHLNLKDEESIYFLARDGYLMKEAYEILFGNLPTKYLYVSRKSVKTPNLHKETDILDIVRKATNKRMVTYDELIDSIGIKETFFNETNKNNLTSKKIDMKLLNPNDEILTHLENFKDEIILNSSVQKSYFLEYLKQFENNYTFNQLNIIDLGWNGTIQDEMAKLIGDKVDIKGYYMGSRPVINKENKKGFLFDLSQKLNMHFEEEFSFFVGPFEMMFLAQEGTTLEYERNNLGLIEPVLQDYELDNTDQLKKINEIQNGALNFIKDISKSRLLLKVGDNANMDLYYEDFRDFFMNPSFNNIRLFSKFSFVDGETIYIANPKSLLYYMIHPKELKFELARSTWKIAFLKQLFKAPLPYRKILLLLKKLA